jgi:hypothetical protein
MPPQDGLRFHEQKSVPPSRNEPSESCDEPALTGGEARLLRSSHRYDELLAQQGVLGDEFESGPDAVSEQPANHRHPRRGGPPDEGC